MTSTITGLIKKAIKNHSQLKITYEGDSPSTFRIINPYYVGVLGDTRQLHAFQQSGYSQSGESTEWKNFHIAKIITIFLLTSTFHLDHGYNPDPTENSYSDIETKIEL